MYIFHLELDFFKDNRAGNGHVAVFVSALLFYMRTAVSNNARYNNGQYGSVAHK